VREFEEALTALLQLCTFTADVGPPADMELPDDIRESWGSLPAVFRNRGVTDERWVAARARVSRAAGRVAAVPEISGVRVQTLRHGALNPFEMWLTITQFNSALTPDDILTTCEHTIGRLEAMAEEIEAAVPADFSVASMHPLVWEAAEPRWRAGQYRDAVAAAAGALVDDVRARTARAGLDEKDVYSQAFSSEAPRPGRPRLRWPGDQQDQTVRSMNRGLLGYSAGIQAAIRNPSIHDRVELTPQEGAERLAAISLLAQWVEQCALVDAPAEGL